MSARAFIWAVLAASVVMGTGCAAPEAQVAQHSAVKKKPKAGSPTLGDADPCASDATGDIGVRALGACDEDVVAYAPPPVVAPVDAAPQTIKASLSVTHLDDTATFTNCLKIQVNLGPEVDLGCNHGGLVPQVTLDALAKPGCNTVRLILFSNGSKNRSTEDPISIARDFRIARTPNGFQIQCNDNGDDNFNDLNVVISSTDAMFSIENTPFTCQL